MIIRDDFIEIDDYFSESDLNRFESAINNLEPGRDSIMPYGPFAHRLIANHINLSINPDIKTWIMDLMGNLLGVDIDVGSIVRTKLYLPWDIHADFYSDRCRSGFVPYYNFMVPMEDIDSSTVIFDQTTQGFNNFSEYKKINQKLDKPLDLIFWNEHLSMCWPEDREYVSLKHIMPLQRRGQLLGFPRRFFHSSDSFHDKHNRYKSFVQIMVDRPL
jgi:hypothetical protein